MSALLYLQSSVASVTDHGDEQETLAFRHCMTHLLSAPPNSDEETRMSEDGVDDGLSASTDRDAIMASSQDFTGLAKRSNGTADRRVWEQRTKLFESLLDFFPTHLQQPKSSLIDLVL